MTDDAVDPPLRGIRVLDLTGGPLQTVGRLLAELGADLTRVTAPGITVERPFGPVVDGIGVVDALAARGARHAEVDPRADPATWRRMLEGADLLVEATPPGSAAEASLDVPRIRAAHPGLVVLSLSDFGRDTRFSRWQATSPVFHALTGVLARTGEPGREPLVPPGELPYDAAAVQAAVQALALVREARRTGRGDRIDFAVLEGATAAIDPAFGMAGSATMGKPLASLPRGRTDEGHKYPILPCRDGHVRICILAARQWRGMFEWMGRPEAFADPKLDLLHVRYRTPSLLPAIAAFFADKTRAELEEEGRRHGVPTAALRSVDEALRSPHLRERGAVEDAELAPGLVAPVPAGFAEVDGMRLRAPARSASPAAARPPAAADPASASRTLPLAGVRVLDLGVIIVGGDSTRILADLGAEVIKVESSAFPDGARASLPPGRMMAGFASGHRNKRSIGIDLTTTEGRRLLHALAARSDLVFSNFKPGTTAKLGLDRATLAARAPGVITVESSAFGATGPWADRLGYGPLVRAAVGFTGRWVHPDLPDRFQDDVTAYPDHVCARLSALLGLALLIRRDRTGTGGAAAFAQAEVILDQLGPELVADALAARGHDVRTAGRDVPWGVFAADGDDDWLVVTARDGADWRALMDVIGRRDLRDDPALADAAGRTAGRTRIEAAVRDWAAAHPAGTAMELLQAAGVPAAAMLRGAELPDWDYFRFRRGFRSERHPYAREPFVLEDVLVHADHVADPPAGQAPMLGQHTVEIATDVLGLSPAEVDDLLTRGVLEAPPLPDPSPEEP
ncbi:CaiB/BaiF CoA-transferase family protein [Microbacterium sp. GXF7504]